LAALIVALLAGFSRQAWSQKTSPVEGFQALVTKPQEKPVTKVGIVSLMRKPVDLPLWFKHHTNMGVSLFFIRLEDSPGLDDYLSLRRDVVYEVAMSDKGDNYKTLQDRQKAFVNKMIPRAKELGIEWLFHIDADELLGGSLIALDSLDASVKTIKIENAEAVYDEKSQDTCFSTNKFLRCGKGAPCRSYVNGKAAGRLVTGVELAGPHDFAYKGDVDGAKKMAFDHLHLLHFDACSLGAWVEKYNHLGKSAKSDIPFPYYKESIGVAKKAYETYKEYTMKPVESLQADLVYKA
jgi:hypothetical protein